MRYGAAPHGAMTKKALLAMLIGVPDTALIHVWDPDTDRWEIVTGCTYDEGTCKLFSDPADEEDAP